MSYILVTENGKEIAKPVLVIGVHRDGSFSFDGSEERYYGKVYDEAMTPYATASDALAVDCAVISTAFPQAEIASPEVAPATTDDTKARLDLLISTLETLPGIGDVIKKAMAVATVKGIDTKVQLM